jgi:hypothetical protein
LDASEVRKLVEEHAPRLRDALGISHWTIAFRYGPLGGDGDFRTPGRCEAYDEYLRACIRLDPEAFDSPEEVLATLRHELFHVVLAPMDLAIIAASRHFPDERASDAIRDVWRHQVEATVLALERMYVGLCEANVSRREAAPGRGKPAAKARRAPKT